MESDGNLPEPKAIEIVAAKPDPISEPEAAVHSAPAAEPVRLKFSLKQFNRSLTLIVSILIKLGGIALVVLVIALFWHELSYKGYSLREVHVPEAFEKSGYTGAMIATSMQEYLGRAKANSRKGNVGDNEGIDIVDYSFDEKQSELEVNLVGVGLPVRSVINFIGSSLGLSQSKSISVYIATCDGKVLMNIFAPDQASGNIYFNLDSLGMMETMNQIGMEMSHYVLKISNPAMLAQVLHDRFENPDKVIAMCEYAIAHTTDTLRNKYSYNIWAWSLIRKNVDLHENNDLNVAVEKFKKAITLDPSYKEPYFGLTQLLRNQGRNAEAKEILEKVIKLEAYRKSDRGRALEGLLYHQMIEYYLHKEDYDSVSVWYDRAYHMALTAQHNKKLLMQGFIAPSLTIGGRLFSQKGKEQQALLITRRALKMATSENINGADLEYTQWFAFQLLNDYYESTKLYDSASWYESGLLRIAAVTKDKRRASQIFNYHAFALSEAKQYDSALYFVHQAILRDSSNEFPYTTYAEIYGYQKKRNLFYTYLELALKKGLEENDIPTEKAPYSYYSHEGKFKDLLKKYKRRAQKDSPQP